MSCVCQHAPRVVSSASYMVRRALSAACHMLWARVAFVACGISRSESNNSPRDVASCVVPRVVSCRVVSCRASCCVVHYDVPWILSCAVCRVVRCGMAQRHDVLWLESGVVCSEPWLLPPVTCLASCAICLVPCAVCCVPCVTCHVSSHEVV